MAKRIFDLVFTIPGIVVLAPVFVIIAILIKYDSSGAVFFRQEEELMIAPADDVVAGDHKILHLDFFRHTVLGGFQTVLRMHRHRQQAEEERE